jgi:hypothetical protein
MRPYLNKKERRSNTCNHRFEKEPKFPKARIFLEKVTIHELWKVMRANTSLFFAPSIQLPV